MAGTAWQILRALKIYFRLSENAMGVSLGEHFTLESNNAMEHLSQLFSALALNKGLQSQEVVDGLKTCLKGGALVASIGVAVLFLKDKIQWIRPQSVKNKNEIELTYPEGRKEAFEREIYKLNLMEYFENIESRLQEVLGKNNYSKVGPEIMQKVGNVRVASVEPLEERISAETVVIDADNTESLDEDVTSNIYPPEQPGIATRTYIRGGSGHKFVKKGGVVNVGKKQ